MANFEPVEVEWAGVKMFRCPWEACSWTEEDKDAVIDHIADTGHFGPDDVDAAEAAEREAEELAAKAREAKKKATEARKAAGPSKEED